MQQMIKPLSEAEEQALRHTLAHENDAVTSAVAYLHVDDEHVVKIGEDRPAKVSWSQDGPRLLATLDRARERIAELEDTIRLREADDDIARSYGRNTHAVCIAEDIRARRGQEWQGVNIDPEGS